MAFNALQAPSGSTATVTDALRRIKVRKFRSAGHVVETDQHWDSGYLGHSLAKTVSRYDIFGRPVQSITADGCNFLPARPSTASR